MLSITNSTYYVNMVDDITGDEIDYIAHRLTTCADGMYYYQCPKVVRVSREI